MNVKLRAALRTAAAIAMVGISCTVVYIFAILGMLPGMMILCGLALVFIMYDTNKSQIEYEDKLDEMAKKYQK